MGEETQGSIYKGDLRILVPPEAPEVQHLDIAGI